MHIAVIDGQGGGIGKALIEKIKLLLGNKVTITALATNSYACDIMKRAGADESFFGEEKIITYCKAADIIVGAIGIIAAGAMMGEITPQIARAVSECDKKKILIPINKCNFTIAGVKDGNLTVFINDAVNIIYKLCN